MIGKLHLVLLAASALVLGGQEPQERKPRALALKKIAVRKGQFRPSLSVPADPPAECWTAPIGKETYSFFDLNGDGVLEPETDGLALGGPFIVPIPDVLLTAAGQFRVAFKETRELLLAQQILGEADRHLAAIAVVTELRIRAGVRPAMLDPKACGACEKHCDYLKLNGLADGSGGVASHQEDEGKPGYTPEGAAAGSSGNLGFGLSGLREGITDWFSGAWHGPPIVSPGLRKMGAALKYGIAILSFSDVSEESGTEQVHPADGSIDAMVSFSSGGEMPNPVAGTESAKGCGFPIFLRLANQEKILKAAVVTDGAGKAVAGTLSCPRKPATKEWAHNSGLALFIPSKPLKPRTLYKVRFEFSEGPAVSWSFSTGSR